MVGVRIRIRVMIWIRFRLGGGLRSELGLVLA